MAQLEERKPDFWDALAPIHASIEDHLFDRRSLRRIVPRIQGPVLVVGAGQGLLVAELQAKGFQCDGIDLSSEMIRYARVRRGLALVHAEAKEMPFTKDTYLTIIYATGVIDFIADEDEIRAILNEGRRVAVRSGEIFVGFYRLSPVLEDFMKGMGMLRHNALFQRESLESYLLNPFQMIAWVANRAGISRLRAATWLVRIGARSTMKEKRMTLRMQRLLRGVDARRLIEAAPETLPYRDEAEIRDLFRRLGIPVKRLDAFASCYIAQI